jgi:hypothetical protein
MGSRFSGPVFDSQLSQIQNPKCNTCGWITRKIFENLNNLIVTGSTGIPARESNRLGESAQAGLWSGVPVFQQLAPGLRFSDSLAPFLIPLPHL